MKKIIFIAFMLSLLTGCISQTYGNNKLNDQTLIDTIVEKKTTSDEVLKLLGQPGEAKTDANGDKLWTYQYGRVTAFGGVTEKKIVSLRVRNGVVIAKDLSGK